MVTGQRILFLGVIGLTTLAVSCTQLLGIEEARVDPSLSGGAGKAGGGSGGASGTGGSAAGATANGGASTGGSAGSFGNDASNDGALVSTTDGSDGGSAVCRQYCDDIMTLCTGNVRQYLDTPQCLKVCALYPEGVVGGLESNTGACRMKYAGKARYAAGSERDAYCRKAGPGSDGTCGAICEGFCTLMMPTCTSARTAPYFFGSMDGCLSTCRALRDNPPYTVSDGALPDSNDSQCRLFHATSAVMDPEEHCEHAMGVTMCDSKADGGGDR
jgi:hypothetical protein